MNNRAMNKQKLLFVLLLFTVGISMYLLSLKSKTPHVVRTMFSCHTSTQSITPLNSTKHLLVSAYMDRRVKGWDLRIIGIFRSDSMMTLHCVFCCSGDLSTNSTPASFVQHTDMKNFGGFPFETMDVMCRLPVGCKASHVTLLNHSDSMDAQWHSFLPVGNQESAGTEAMEPQFNLTVCISTLFGDYNNVLQFTQALEMYRLLGVDRVVVYNTSCGPDLDLLLRSYAHEGFVEVVPWPVDKHLTPSRGWRYREHGPGDLHYYGQVATLNECVYRYMDRSRYVALHDIDEIIVPYGGQSSLLSLVSQLQRQNPSAGEFLFKMHRFPTNHEDPSAKFRLPQWEGVPGINILEHTYMLNEEDKTDTHKYDYKMIVRPRMVQQTSVHRVIMSFGKSIRVPANMGSVIHVRGCLITHTIPPSYSQNCLSKEHMVVDTRLWEFQDKLIPSVDKALGRIGLLREWRP